MIEENGRIFYLTTKHTSYIFKARNTGQLENLHYGKKLRNQDFRAIEMKLNAGAGSSVIYSKDKQAFSMDLLPLEYSFNGKGDYRHMPLELEMPDGTYVGDFVFDHHEIIKGTVAMNTLPTAHGNENECETLILTLKDKLFRVELLLYYTVFYDTDIITRRVKLLNQANEKIVIRKIMSLSLDILGYGYDMITLDGGWIKEAHVHRKELGYGLMVNDSTTGSSSNRHNPGVIFAKKDTREDTGVCYGFNLVYSSNHYTAIERSNHDLIRVMTGINPHNFNWILEPGENFESPEALMSFSSEGLNGLSHHMHDFINHHIVRGEFKEKERPVLMNNWEATFFDFNERKLMSLAKEAKKLGIELFVLDDGWFGERNDDTKGLGDYNVNLKKLPGGIIGLARKIKALGMDFGIWIEPEMVNENSDLYRKHPEYAVKIKGREPSLGRNQLVLDLCRKDVQDYIIEQVNRLLKSAEISYVKWDMNRHLSDMQSDEVKHQGMFYHSYIIGLYKVLKRITEEYPEVLFESCSSGGNRFDLGMLSYMPQVWASDNTDPIERLKIQEGLSYFYPLSAIGAHVSQSPHQQTLRNTPLETRFNVAAFGLLGYELDLNELNLKEKEEVKRQIAWYKTNRRLMQFGRFYRFDKEKLNRVNFQVTDLEKKESVLGNFQILQEASPSFDVLMFKGLNEEAKYKVTTLQQNMDLKYFGHLIKHVIPLKLKSDGLILKEARKYYRLPNNKEEYIAYGDMLSAGIRVNQQYMGTGYQKDTRILKDFGSQLMEVKIIEDGVRIDTRGQLQEK
ncbi:MAG: alpha-galactosidase [Clostridiaceae bacterium]